MLRKPGLSSMCHMNECTWFQFVNVGWLKDGWVMVIPKCKTQEKQNQKLINLKFS